MYVHLALFSCRTSKIAGSGRLVALEVSDKCAEAAVQAVWLGHATVLVQLDGLTLLTDPIFSERCSPVQFLGPRCILPHTVLYSPACCLCSSLIHFALTFLGDYVPRNRNEMGKNTQAGILSSHLNSLQRGSNLLMRQACRGCRRVVPSPVKLGCDELPHIDAVLISHTHYDHLDAGTVAYLHSLYGAGLAWYSLAAAVMLSGLHACGGIYACSVQCRLRGHCM